MDKDIQALASQLYSPLFSHRDNIRDAYNEAIEVAMECENPAAVTTAVHVLMNSIATRLEYLNTTRRVVVTGNRTSDPEATEEELARPAGL
jgi:hypothetical protein